MVDEEKPSKNTHLDDRVPLSERERERGTGTGEKEIRRYGMKKAKSRERVVGEKEAHKQRRKRESRR